MILRKASNLIQFSSWRRPPGWVCKAANSTITRRLNSVATNLWNSDNHSLNLSLYIRPGLVPTETLWYEMHPSARKQKQLGFGNKTGGQGLIIWKNGLYILKTCLHKQVNRDGRRPCSQACKIRVFTGNIWPRKYLKYSVLCTVHEGLM